MNRRAYFSRQLAMCFYHVDWHFRTLLGITIECVRELPDDSDDLINDLLLAYPEKPPEKTIVAFLDSSQRVSNWFRYNSPSPAITRFNLCSPDVADAGSTDLPKIDTPIKLADWLGISRVELDWFCNLRRLDTSTPEHIKHYQYDLLEKRDGRIRLIEKPKTTLKHLQNKINKEILSTLDIHPAAHGFCEGRSCMSHASKHVGKRYLLLFDIAECFHSIGWPSIKSVFNQRGYPDAVSTCLAALCTHSVQLERAQFKLFDRAQQERLKQRHLPQGAPTSPALANATLNRLDYRLSGLAKSLQLDYSRYADDIALSGNAHRDWRFLEPLVGGICLDEGVCLNYKKTRIKRSHQKQRLVGIVVNSKPNIDRKYFDELKAILTNCIRHGLDSQNRQAHPNFRAHLIGRIQYVKSLNGQRGVKLEQLFQKISHT